MPPTRIPADAARQSIDWQHALDARGGDKQLLDEIILCFLEEIPRFVVDIREAIEEGDSRILGIKASALQGRLSFFGLKPVVDAVVQLKLKARSQDISDCWRDLAGIEPWIAAILQEIGKPNAQRQGIVRPRLNDLVSPIDRRCRILSSPRNCRPAWRGSGRANRTREERVKTHLAELAVPRRTTL